MTPALENYSHPVSIVICRKVIRTLQFSLHY